MRNGNGRPDGAIVIHTYRKLEEYLAAFAEGHLNLLILIGRGGLAKSRTVRAVVGSEACFIDGTVPGADTPHSGNFLAHAVMEGIVTSIRWVHHRRSGRKYDTGTGQCVVGNDYLSDRNTDAYYWKDVVAVSLVVRTIGGLKAQCGGNGVRRPVELAYQGVTAQLMRRPAIGPDRVR